MTLSSFEGPEATVDPYGGGVGCDTGTLLVETEEASGHNLKRSDRCSAYAEEATPLCRVQEDNDDSGKGAAALREENGKLKNDRVKLEGPTDKELVGNDALTEDHLERTNHRRATNLTLEPSCIPVRLIQPVATSLTPTSVSYEEDAGNSIEEKRIESTSEDPTLQRRSASALRGPPRTSQHVIIDMQALQVLQERLLFSEERLWVTQRQLVDEQGKVLHMKSQILYLEDEVERAQAEGLATATRYAKQAKTVEQLQDKISRLAEENDSLESCLSEKISEGRALQELAERLVLRLGNKTDALLEEGICVTRVLAPAWNKQELLAELEKKNLLGFQLAHVALFYCRDGAASTHTVSRAEAALTLEEDLPSVQAPVVTDNAATGSSLSPCGKFNTQTTAASALTAAADHPAGRKPQALAVTEDSSFSCDVLVEDQSGPVLAGETVKRQGTHNTAQLRRSAEDPTLVEGVSTVASAVADCLRRRGECTGADLPSGASSVQAPSPSFSPCEEKAPARTRLPSDCLRAWPAGSLVHDAAEAVAAQQPILRCSRSFPELAHEASLSEKRKRGTRETQGFSSLKQQGGLREADHSRHAASAASAAAFSDFHRSLVDAEPHVSCRAPRLTARKTERTSALVDLPLNEASRSRNNTGIGGAHSIRCRHLQRVLSDVSHDLARYNRLPSPSSSRSSAGEAGVTADRGQSCSGETFVTSFRGQDAEAALFEPCVTKDSCQNRRQREAQFSHSISEAEGGASSGGWSGAAKKAAGSLLSKSYSELLKDGSHEGGSERVYPREGCSSLVPTKSDGEAVVLESGPICDDGSLNGGADKTVGRAASSKATNSAAAVPPQKKQISRPSSRSKRAPALQPPRRAWLDSRLTYAGDSYGGQRSGSQPSSAERTAAGVDWKRCPSSLGRPLVAAKSAGAKAAFHSPQVAAAAGGTKGTLPSQTTPGATLPRDDFSPRAAATTGLRQNTPAHFTQHVPQRLENAQQHAQLTELEPKCDGKVQSPPPTLIFSTAAAGKDEQIQLDGVGADRAACEQATAAAKLPADKGVFSDETSSYSSEFEEDGLFCASSSPSAARQPPSRENQATIDAAATTRGVDGDAGVYDVPEKQGEQPGCRGANVQDNEVKTNSSGRQVNHEAGHVNELRFPMDPPSVPTEEPSQVAQRPRTDFPTDAEQQAPVPLAANYFDDHSSCARLFPVDLQKSSSRRRLCGLNLEELKFVRAGARRSSLAREEAVRAGEINAHITHAKQVVPSGSGGGPLAAASPTGGETMAVCRRPAASRLPPLPQHYQIKLARASMLSAEFNDYSSSPVLCQGATRPFAGTNVGRREPSAVGARLLKRLNSGDFTCAAEAPEKMCFSGENGSGRRSSRRPSRANRCVELEDRQEAPKDNILRTVPSMRLPEPCVSLYSSGSAAGSAAGAASLCPGTKSSKTRQSPVENRRRSHRAVKAVGTSTAQAHQQAHQQQEEQRDVGVSSREACAAAQRAASQRSRNRKTGETKSAYSDVDCKALARTASSLAGSGHTVSGGATAYESEHFRKESSCPRGLVESIRPDASTSSLSCKSAISSEGLPCKASSRRLSLRHACARDGRGLKARGPRTGNVAGVQAAMRRESCAASRSSSAFTRRTLTASHPAASNSKKRTGTSSNSSTCLYDGSLASSPSFPLSDRTSCNGRSSSRSNASSGSSTSSVYNGCSNADDLVYHALPASGRAEQPAAAAPALCADQRSRGDSSRRGGDASVYTNGDDGYTASSGELHAPSPCSRPSSAGDYIFGVTSDKSCITPNSGRQQQGQWYATTYFDTAVSRPSKSSTSKESSSSFGVVRGNDKASSNPLAVAQSMALFSPVGGTVSAEEAREASGENSGKSEEDLCLQATSEGLTTSAEAAVPTAASAACLFLSSEVSLTDPQADASHARGWLGAAGVKYRQGGQEEHTDREKQQDHEKNSVNYALTPPPPRVASWSSFDALSGAQTAPSTRSASMRISLPLPSGTCIPARLAPPSACTAASKLPAGTLEPKDATQATQGAERAGDWRVRLAESAASTGGAADQQRLETSRRGEPTALLQARSETLADAPQDSFSIADETQDSPTAGEPSGRTSGTTSSALISSSDVRASEGKPPAALRGLPTQLDVGQLNSKQGIQEEKADAPGLAVATMSNAPACTGEKSTTSFQQDDMKAKLPSTADSDPLPTQTAPAAAAFGAAAAAGGCAETSYDKPCQDGSSKNEGLVNAWMRFTAPSLIPVQSTYAAAARNKYSPFDLHQRPPATNVYRPTLCCTFAAPPAATTLSYGAAPAAFPLFSRSSVPPQQQSRTRTAQKQEFRQQQQQGTAATLDQRSDQRHMACSQQQPHYLVDWGTRLHPQPWQPLQPQQPQRHQAAVQPPLCKGPQMGTQVTQPLLGSWQCQRQQQPGSQQHQQAQPQCGSALTQAEARQPLQQHTQLQLQMQQRQKQATKLGQSRSQPSRVLPTQFVRQTLPRRGAENALGLPLLPHQQQIQQQQGMIREKLRQQQEATTINGKLAPAAASDQQSPGGARRVIQLQQQQQRQKKGNGRVHQQRRSTTGPPQQDMNDVQEENQQPHSVGETALLITQQTVRQRQPQERERICRYPGQEQSQAGSQQQQQLVPGTAEQYVLGGPNAGESNHAHGPLKAQLQLPLPQQVKQAKEGPQLQQQSTHCIQHSEQQQQSHGSQGGQQTQGQPVRYPWGTAILEQHLQPQAKQQQQQPHAMSMRWSCETLNGSKQELQEPFRPHQQLQHQVQLQLQQHMQRGLVQQQFQNLHLDGRHQHPQLQQLQQQWTQPDQLQQQRTQQQVLQQQFWKVMQMYHGGSVPTCTEKGNLTNTVHNTPGKSSLMNLGTHPINHKAFACDSRATISAGINRNAAIPVAACRLPFDEAQRPPSATLAFSGRDTSTLLNNTYLPAASSLPPGIPTIQASRLTAPVFPAAVAATSKGRVWPR